MAYGGNCVLVLLYKRHDVDITDMVLLYAADRPTALILDCYITFLEITKLFGPRKWTQKHHHKFII